MGKKYTTNFLEDTNGSTGASNQVLISTPTGIDWVDGSGSSIIGGPYVTIGTAQTITGTKTFAGDITTNGDIIIDNSSGDPFLKLKTVAQEYVLRIDQSDSEKFQIRNTTSSVTALSIDTSSNATFAGNVTVASGHIQTTVLYLSSDIRLLNKLGNNWLNFATRDITGSEAVYNLSNVGNATFAGKIDTNSGPNRFTHQQNAGSRLELYNNRQDASNVEVYRIAAYNFAEVTGVHFYRGSGGNSGYTKIFSKKNNSSNLEEVVQFGTNDALTTTFAGDVSLITGKQLIFDGGTDATYISEDIADRLRFFVGGAEFMRFTEGTADDINFYHNATFAGDITATNGRLTVTHDSNNVAKIIQSATSMSNATYTFVVDSTSHVSNMSAAGAMKVDVNSGRAFTITGAGNVGIKTTSPDALLDIGVNNIITLDDTGSSTGFIGMGSYNDGTKNRAQGASYYGFGLEIDRPNQNISFNSYDSSGVITAGTNILVLKRTGNVGIGTTSPDLKLDVESTNSTVFSGTGYRVALFQSTSAVNADKPGITLGYDTTGGGIIAPATQAGTTNFLGFWTYNSGWGERVRIAKDGKVGIGLTSPAAKLDVINSHLSTMLRLSNTEANATIKYGAVLGRHYTNAEENVTGMLITSSSSVTGGSVSIGGGISDSNAVNEIKFYTAANNTTLTGTERMRITNVGNIEQGIVGTTASAYYYFNSTTTGDTGVIFRDNSSTNSGFSTYNHDTDSMKFGTGGSEKMRITSSADANKAVVAIGITPSNWYNYTALQVGTGSLQSPSDNTITLGCNYYVDSGVSTSETYITNGSATAYQQGSGTHAWYTAPSGTAGNGVTFTERMRITNAGKVGIGTDNPVAKLTVQGDDADIFLRSNDYTIARIINRGSTGSNLDIGIFSLYSANAENVRFDGGGTNWINSGNVGIGTTNPGYKLTVNGDVDVNNGAILAAQAYGINLGVSGYDIVMPTTSRIAIKTSATERVSILSNGNVGIGTTNPVAKLHIDKANANSSVIISRSGSNLSTSTGVGSITFPAEYNSSYTDYAAIQAYSNNLSAVRGSLDLKVKSTSGNLLTGLTVYGTSSGPNVGIGTTSPGAKLDVAGSINTSGSINLTNAGLNTIAASNSSNGYLRFLVDQQGVALTLNADTTSTFGGEIYTVDGTKAQPSYSFTNDTDTGMMSDGSDTLRFVTGASTRMTIEPNGEVGINATSPSATLHLKAIASNGVPFKLEAHPSTSVSQMLIYATKAYNSTDAWYNLVCEAGNGSGGQLNTLIIERDGDVRNKNNSYGQISDIRLKENITDATPKLEDIKKLKVKNFNLIGDDLKQIGLIAQEVEEVFPGLVKEDKQPDINGEEGGVYKSVKYSVLVPMLIKAMQEQQEQIDELKKQINN